MPYWKGALHVHTHLSDGILSPAETVRTYRELGFHFLAVTDHDYMVGNNDRYFAAIPPGDEDFLVFKGIEIEWAEIRYHHVSKIWGERELLVVFNHPEQYGLTVEEVKERIEVISRTLTVDAIEVTHKGCYSRTYDTDAIPLPKVATDDSHHPEDCGLAWVEVEAPFEKDAIIRAIKAGDFRIEFQRNP